MDQLTDKLKEERVRNIIQPILKGEDTLSEFNDNDLMYLIDLGLVNKLTGGKVEIANEIYKEIIPRELVWTTQATIHHETVWYVDRVTNKIDFRKLLTAFQEFFQENSEIWIDQFAYREAGPQLLLQAFLQRIVNGGGIINREYGLGTRRTDLYIKWYYNEQDRSVSQKAVIECKLLHKTLEKTIQEGLEQLTLYADTCSAEESHLLIFDRTKDKPWEEKVFLRESEYNRRKILVWGM